MHTVYNSAHEIDEPKPIFVFSSDSCMQNITLQNTKWFIQYAHHFLRWSEQWPLFFRGKWENVFSVCRQFVMNELDIYLLCVCSILYCSLRIMKAIRVILCYYTSSYTHSYHKCVCRKHRKRISVIEQSACFASGKTLILHRLEWIERHCNSPCGTMGNWWKTETKSTHLSERFVFSNELW